MDARHNHLDAELEQLSAAPETPERGYDICYAYLWHAEHQQGRDEGSKASPCGIVLAVESSSNDCVVTVLPVKRTAPSDLNSAVEIPAGTKRRLGLDDARSRIMVSECNRFAWPGTDLCQLESGHFNQGFLPLTLFRQVQRRIAAYVAPRRLRVMPRTEWLAGARSRPSKLASFHATLNQGLPL